MRAGVPRRQRRLLTGTLRGPLKRVHSSPTKPRAQRAPRHAVERIPTVNYSGKAVFEWMRCGDLTAGVRTVWQAAIVDGDRRSDPPARRRAGLVRYGGRIRPTSACRIADTSRAGTYGSRHRLFRLKPEATSLTDPARRAGIPGERRGEIRSGRWTEQFREDRLQCVGPD